MLDDVSAEARRLAANGRPVFPLHVVVDGECSCGRGDDCGSPGKHPLTRDGFKSATADAQQIAKWWPGDVEHPYSIGLPTGPSSRTLVVDLDGPDGIASWASLCFLHGDHERTRRVETGGGGWHLYFRLPPTGPAYGPALRNSRWRLGWKIDTRGEGGYVVAPPSSHPSGGRYRVLDDAPLAELPEWARVILAPRTDVVTPPGPARIRGESSRYGEGVLTHALQRTASAQPGTRNETLNAECFLVGQFVGGGEIDPRGVAEAFVRVVSAWPNVKKSTQTIQRALHDGALYPRSKDEKK